MQWVIEPLRRYADFSGRTGRKEFWIFTLAGWVALFIAALIEDLLGLEGPGQDGMIVSVLLLASLCPWLAIAVRRLHDQDKSGWNMLWYFFPMIGAIIILVYMCLEGTRGENRFGSDPNMPHGDLDDVFA